MSKKWINLGAFDTPQNWAIQSFFETVYQSRIQPTKGSEDVFGDLRSLLQRGFTGGEDWVTDWSKRFVGEKQQTQMMAYLSDYFGRPITTMDEAAFEFDFFALKTLHQKMDAAGLHARFAQPDISGPGCGWGLDVLSAEQVTMWEKAHHRTLPESLKRVYLELFGGMIFTQDQMPTNWYLLDHMTGPFPSLATLETILHRAGVDYVERRLSQIQYGINQLASDRVQYVTNPQYAKIVHPQLAKSLVLDRYCEEDWADFIFILVEFGPLDQHIIQLADVINDPGECVVTNEGPLSLWLIKAYLNAWLDLGV